MEAAGSNAMADVWHERIAAQRASGLSIRQWCRQNGQHEHSFYWWRRRLGLWPQPPVKRRHAGQRQRLPGQAIGFAKVAVVNHAEPSIRLQLRGGHELHLPVSMPLGQIAQLVRAIAVGEQDQEALS